MSTESEPVRLTPQQHQILLASRVGHLATTGQDGQPYVVPCCFAVSDGEIVTPIDEKPKTVPGRRLRRIRNLLENPRVSFVVDHFEEDWSKIGYLLILGQATLIEPGRDRPAALAALRAKYRQYG
ncbi:MAG TPA: TIGR03668 family PPOX class F420-dependent oxidoreductase, partial [Dehalococcoidia bacterium]|nr:TIGR03668 family PPOX class F420-dependent oxidoreductase [Dehalococcoidia bacterium]